MLDLYKRDASRRGQAPAKQLTYWKKYVDKAINNFYNCEASTLFICGHTLSLHGFFLEKTYEQKASLFIKQSLENCKDESLFELIKTFQAMSNQKNTNL